MEKIFVARLLWKNRGIKLIDINISPHWVFNVHPSIMWFKKEYGNNHYHFNSSFVMQLFFYASFYVWVPEKKSHCHKLFHSPGDHITMADVGSY